MQTMLQLFLLGLVSLSVSVYAFRLSSVSDTSLDAPMQRPSLLQLKKSSHTQTPSTLPSVAFGILTSQKPEYVKKLQSPLSTWAQGLSPSELLIVGSAPPAGMEDVAHWDAAAECSDNHDVGVSCKEALLISNARDLGVDWLVVLGEDNYVFPQNVKETLAKFDPNEAQSLAIIGCDTQNCIGACGGGGEFISRGAMARMFENGHNYFMSEHAYISRNVCEGWCDMTTSMVAKRHGVELKSLEGLHGWPLSRNELLSIMKDESQKPLTFHYVSADDFIFVHGFAKRTSPEPVAFLADIESEHFAYNRTLAEFVLRSNRDKYSTSAADYYSRAGRQLSAGAPMQQ